MAIKAKKKPTTAKRKRRCIVPGCDRQAVARGVCWRCYRFFENEIKSGRTTEKKLIAKKLVLPSTQQNRSIGQPKSPAKRALEKLR